MSLKYFTEEQEKGVQGELIIKRNEKAIDNTPQLLSRFYSPQTLEKATAVKVGRDCWILAYLNK